MAISHRLFIKLFTALSALALLPAANAADWQLSASPVMKADGRWYLRIGIRNTSQTDATVVRSLLPWRYIGEMTFTALPLTGNPKAIPPAPPTQFQPVLEQSEWPAGQYEEGDIALQNLFPTIGKINEQFPISVCFDFRFSRLDRKSKTVAMECVVLPARAEK